MASPFLRVAQKELAGLEEKLGSNPDFRRWQALKATIEAYQGSAPTSLSAATATSTAAPPPTSSTSSSTPPPAPARPTSRAPEIVAAAVAYLREINRRMNSTQMAPELIKRGVPLSGKNPASTLSAYLSAAKDLIDNRRDEGYGLKEWTLIEEKSAGTPDSGQLSGAPIANGHHPVT